MGPRAAVAARTGFEQIGYRTWLVPSPWRLGAPDRALAERLVDGWAAAATEQGHPRDADRIERWAVAKKSALAEGAVTLVVGHLDLLALPPAGRPLG